MDWSTARVCVTGGAGFLGQAVCARLRVRGVSDDRLFIPRQKDYDLTVEADVVRMYDDAKPDVVIHLAAEVGGIGANRDHAAQISPHRRKPGDRLDQPKQRSGFGILPDMSNLAD